MLQQNSPWLQHRRTSVCLAAGSGGGSGGSRVARWEPGGQVVIFFF